MLGSSMGSHRGIIGTVMAAFTLLLAACGLGPDPTPDYRYLLTVAVETPDGPKTGSSVIEVETSVAGEYSLPTPGRVSHKVRGEAVAVDLGDGQVLFALLRSPNDIDWASNAMFLITPRRANFQATFDAMLGNREEMILPQYFRDRGHIRNQPAKPCW